VTATQANGGLKGRLEVWRAWMFAKIEERAQTLLLLLAVIVGVLMGVVAAIFRKLLALSHDFFHHAPLISNGGMADQSLASIIARALLPAFGGLLVGFLVYRLFKLQGGHGVPSVMKAVATGNVELSPSMALKSSTSIITMTSGGSTGPEGPIVEIGSVVGSTVGRFGRMARDHVATLIGCGAASGVAAIFNAPIGGVFLALELILRDFAIRAFAPVVIAAVTASVTTQALLPNDPTLMRVPDSLMAAVVPSARQAIAFALLGVLCGVVSGVMVRSIYKAHDFFHAIQLPMWYKPALGGVAVGIVGLFLPEVIGEGYMFVNGSILGPSAMEGPLSTSMSIVLFYFLAAGLKIFATSMTLGSGGTGGSFAPAMVVGASLGAGFGTLCHLVAPTGMPHPAIFALVGMAGSVATTLSLPIAGILIVYEVAGAPYQLVLPLMICVATGSLIANSLKTGSVYTLSLLRDGFDVDQAVRQREDPLGSISVGEIMRRDMTTLKPEDNLKVVLSALSATLEDDFAVVNAQRELVGLISTRDLRGVLALDEHGEAIIAADAADPSPKTLLPASTAAEALAIFSASDVTGIPVVASATSRRLVGIVTRFDVLKAYRSAGRE